jgi:hypothetical protein
MRDNDSVLLEKIYLEDVDYRGEHFAPDKESGAPLYDLTKVYPDDVYSNKAPKYYGDLGGDNRDVSIFSFVQSYRNKPKRSIKIYRAIPNILKNEEKELKKLNAIIWEVKVKNAHNFEKGWISFPFQDKTVKEFFEKHKSKFEPIENYNDINKFIFSEIEKMAEELEKKIIESKRNLKINKGDWVTIDKNYAKEHGQSSLNNNYKILSKTVKAEEVYTAGDSIFEWGYDPV